MNDQFEDRRKFLQRAVVAAFAAPLLLGCRPETLAQQSDDALALIRKNARPRGTEGMGAIDVPDAVSWRVSLAGKSDDAMPLIVSGTVYEPDGRRPAPNVLIYFYHTDAAGLYGRGDEHRHGRFRGWLLTDERGRYEFRSIRPASYPNSTISAHIHMTVTGKDFREDWIDSILFEGDRFISARERETAGRRGGFNPIVKLEKGADGIFRAERDIQLWRNLPAD